MPLRIKDPKFTPHEDLERVNREIKTAERALLKKYIHIEGDVTEQEKEAVGGKNDQHVLGLLHAAHVSWAQEKSFELDPQLVWYSVLAELGTFIQKEPDQFKDLFTDSSEKKEIKIPTSSETDIDPRWFIEVLSSLVPDKELVEAMTSPFESESSEIYKKAVASAFLAAAAPYYDYSTFRCGLPEIVVQGSAKDWEILVDKLKILLSKFGSKGEKPLGDVFLVTAVDRAKEMFEYVSGDKTPPKDFASKFYSFEPCGSKHHTPDGWFAGFFPKKTTAEIAVPVTTWAWHDVTTGSNFAQVYGIGEYEIVNGVVCPRICAKTFLINDEKLFKKISHKRD